MIFGIGHDIVETSRILKLYEEFGERFLQKYFTKDEIEASQKFDNSLKINFFAKRYAAKEALSKAIGTGIRGDVSFLNMSVSNDQFGKPEISLGPILHDFLIKQIKFYKIHLSLTDEKNTASAFVIIENVGG